jgi:hypothetical protein
VLVDATTDDVWLHDPALDDGPSRLATEAFMLAWGEFDDLAAVIAR